MKKILILLLLFALAQMAYAQQGQIFTWSSTKCSDGTATVWPGCQSAIVPSGSYYSEGVSGLFAEELDGRNANVGVTVTKINSNFVVHVGFQAALSDSSFTVQPPDAVIIESNSSIHTTISATLYPDRGIQAHKDADVMKQRFKDKAPITVTGAEWTFGYLFFPYDDGASLITIVVQAGNETFRFPFAKNPSLNEWLDPARVSEMRASVASPRTASPTFAVTASSVPTEQPSGTDTRAGIETSTNSPAACVPTAAASAAAPQASLKIVSFAIADPKGGVHPGMAGWTENWIRKNAKKYPNVLFQQGCPIRGAENYLVVFSASASALSGFDPVVTTNTSTNTTPVSGSGTVTDNYGSTWDYTFSGDVTTTTTTTTQENIPYTIQSNTLYATAYDEHGVIVSQRWHVYNSKQGGDAANSLGYNLGSALGAINSRGRLLNAVVKDIAGKKKK